MWWELVLAWLRRERRHRLGGVLDAHHVTVKEMVQGFRITIGSVHAKTGFRKTVRVGSKADAHLAIQLILAFYNAMGRPITWIHTDNAQSAIPIPPRPTFLAPTSPATHLVR